MFVASSKRFVLGMALCFMLCCSDAKAGCICEDAESDNQSVTAQGVGTAKKPAPYAVFSGRVEEVRFIDAYDYVAKVKVIKMWNSMSDVFLKGKYLYVGSTVSDKDCGMLLTIGGRYLFRTDYKHNLLVIDGCGQTKHIQEVTEKELEALGKPAFEYSDALSGVDG